MQEDFNQDDELWGEEDEDALMLSLTPLLPPLEELVEKEEDSSPSFLGIDWAQYDYADGMQKRMGGVTKESFAMEGDIFQALIDQLPSYDEKALRGEIGDWNLSIPGSDSFDFESLSETYSRIIAYRTRLVEIIGAVNGRHELLVNAHKSLKEMAHKLYTGTVKERDASATYAVQHWLVGSVKTKQFLAYLFEMKLNIDFVTARLDSLMYERRSLARINSEYVREGDSHRFHKSVNDSSTPAQHKSTSETKIRTFKFGSSD